MESLKRSAPGSRVARMLALFAIAFALQGMSMFLLSAEKAHMPEQRMSAAGDFIPWTPTITYTINTDVDAEDVNPGDGNCADAEGNCPFRAALQECNAFGQPCGIIFDLPGTHPSGVFTLTMGSMPVPPVTTPARIDGTTQPGHDIHIDYSNLMTGHGLVLDGTDGSIVNGLGIFNPPQDCILVDNAPNSYISGNRLKGCGGNYGVRIVGTGSAGTIVSNNIMQNSPGGFRLENTSTITVTGNTVGPVDFFGGDAEGSSNVWILNNQIQGVGFADGFASFGGVTNVWINNNTFSEIERFGINAMNPTTGLHGAGNSFIDIGSLPIFLESGVNNDAPAPEILHSHQSGGVVTTTLRVPGANPEQYEYPLTVEFFVNQGNTWLPFGTGTYEATDYPESKEYVLIYPGGGEVQNGNGHIENDPTEFVEATVTTADGNMSMMSADEVALPITLAGFEAIVDGRDVLLRWSSAAEINSAGFEVQLLQKGLPGVAPRKGWQTRDFVPALGAPRTYSHRIQQLDPGSYSFRLALIDLDGKTSFSPQVEVQIEVADAYLLSAAYPNPFNPMSRFTLAVAQDQHVQIRLFDVQGRHRATIYDGRLSANQTYPFELDGSGMASGVYLLRVTGEVFDVARSIMLVK